MAGRLRVTLRKSPISYTAAARGTVRALGLHGIGSSSELPDNPAVRGMTRAIRFLVEVEEIDGTGTRTATQTPAPAAARTERPAATAEEPQDEAAAEEPQDAAIPSPTEEETKA
jgi:large subunit ribosomal protein L30